MYYVGGWLAEEGGAVDRRKGEGPRVRKFVKNVRFDRQRRL